MYFCFLFHIECRNAAEHIFLILHCRGFQLIKNLFVRYSTSFLKHTYKCNPIYTNPALMSSISPFPPSSLSPSLTPFLPTSLPPILPDSLYPRYAPWYVSVTIHKGCIWVYQINYLNPETIHLSIIYIYDIFFLMFVNWFKYQSFLRYIHPWRPRRCYPGAI